MFVTMAPCLENGMTYTEAMAYIWQIQTGAAIKPGLEVTGKLMQYFDNPQDRLSFIHIAGTNGKGSTAAFISAIYAGQGLKVGRFVTPALFSRREQIQYTKGSETVYITEEEMAGYITKIRCAIDRMQSRGDGTPTVFEIETAVAFLAFADWNCDLVVLETGMGGRADATNIIRTPECAVITPVALDHMKFLGNSIVEIAREKAGIIKNHVPVVASRQDDRVEEVLEQVCREQGCRFQTVLTEDICIRKSSPYGTCFDYKQYKNLNLSLCGLFQVENACLAVECAEAVRKRFPCSEEDIRRGLAGAVWRGRFEILCTDPVVVVDGAHNPDGLNCFLESVNAYYKAERKIAVMGVFADKDYAKMAESAADTFDRIYTVAPPSERGLPADILAEQFRPLKTTSGEAGPETVLACASLEEAVSLALKDCRAPGEAVLFIFGSLSLVKGAYNIFGINSGLNETL